MQTRAKLQKWDPNPALSSKDCKFNTDEMKRGTYIQMEASRGMTGWPSILGRQLSRCKSPLSPRQKQSR